MDDLNPVQHPDGAPARALLAQAMSRELLVELRSAHQIILNALSLMTSDQTYAWARLNERDGVIGEGTTRYHERSAVLRRASGI